MSRGIAAALNRKRRLWKQARTTGDIAAYKEAAKEVKNMIRRSKLNFEKKKKERLKELDMVTLEERRH